MALDIEEQYEKIYRFCYCRLRSREQAEDVTQETFLRWFVSDTYRDTGQVLRYLYTVARNLCTDVCRRPVQEPLLENLPDMGEDPLPSIALRAALERLDVADRELVLLRCVNEVPMGVLCGLYGQSRFALYRRLNRVLKTLKNTLEEREDVTP